MGAKYVFFSKLDVRVDRTFLTRQDAVVGINVSNHCSIGGFSEKSDIFEVTLKIVNFCEIFCFPFFYLNLNYLHYILIKITLKPIKHRYIEKI